MENYDLLKSIFNEAHNGNYNIPELPEGISRDVVERNVLYIELQNLKKSNGDINRITEIEAILYPVEDEGEEDNG